LWSRSVERLAALEEFPSDKTCDFFVLIVEVCIDIRQQQRNIQQEIVFREIWIGALDDCCLNRCTRCTRCNCLVEINTAEWLFPIEEILKMLLNSWICDEPPANTMSVAELLEIRTFSIRFIVCWKSSSFGFSNIARESLSMKWFFHKVNRKWSILSSLWTTLRWLVRT
jgi:hypothetical protein